MKNLTKLGLLLAFSLVASTNFAHACDKPDTDHKAKAVRISGTIAGAWDYVLNAWAGYTFIQFGDQPVKTARLVDRGGDGTEIQTLTFLDGSGSFEIVCQYTIEEGSTPMLLELIEEGTITNGTGDYANASGSVRVRGPFLAFDPPAGSNDPTPINPWIASMHGEIRGLAKK
jgi:hypothetical protein